MIATLTFHEALSYGAVLQTYALQRAIMELGYETEVLNYSCEAIKKRYSKPNGIKARLSWMLKTHTRNARKQKFDSFISSHVVLSEYVSKDNLSSFCNKYEKVIVGSDQVWNPLLTKNDTTYFLDFLELSVRASYAASIGLEKWPDDVAGSLSKKLSKFDFLTVRERTAADYLSATFGLNANVVCDPVFLVDRSVWDTIAINPVSNGQYILLYVLSKPSDRYLRWAKQLSKMTGLRLAVVHNSPFPVGGVDNIRDAGPEELLGLIKSAEVVLTDSFHGTCFSILFNRPFYWLAKDGSTLRNRSSRLVDLLTLFNLQNRVPDYSSTTIEQIDYSPVNAILAEYLLESKDILKSIVEDRV